LAVQMDSHWADDLVTPRAAMRAGLWADEKVASSAFHWVEHSAESMAVNLVRKLVALLGERKAESTDGHWAASWELRLVGRKGAPTAVLTDCRWAGHSVSTKAVHWASQTADY